MVPQSSSLDITEELTLSAWINGGKLSNEGGVLNYGKAGYAGQTTYAIWTSSYYATSMFDLAQNSRMMVESSPLLNDVWYHLSYTFLDGTGYAFVNGKQTKTKTSSDYQSLALQSGRDLRIGVDQPGGPEYFWGIIDDIRIYNRALSAEEVRLLYEAELELPEQSVTSAKLSPALSDLIDGNGSLEQALPAGSVIARKPGETRPPGYTLFQRNEYNASLVWEEKAPVSVARYAGDGLIALDDKIYFVGGYNLSSGVLEAKDLVEKYDPYLDLWELMSPMQEAREGLASALLGGKIYVMGGKGKSSVEVYDPILDQWEYEVELPRQTERSCAVTFGEKIILTGGFNGYSYLSNVLEFEPQRGTWIELAPMSSGHEGHKSVVKDDRIWVVGGLNSGNALDKVESYDAFTNTWRQEPSLNTPRSWPVVWTTSEGIYAAGGNDGNSFLSSIEFLPNGGSAWVPVAGDLPRTLYGADTIALNGSVYLVGGYDGNSFSDEVYAADLPAPAMNLYFKEGNTTAEAELSTLGLADGSVTLGQLAPDSLAKLGLDHNPATAEGSLLAVPRSEQPPPGYALYKRSDRNGSLVWEQKAPVSVARYAGDGLITLDDKIYFVGGYNLSSGVLEAKDLVEKYDPYLDLWELLSPMQEAREGLASALLGGKIYVMGGKGKSSVEVYDPILDQWEYEAELPRQTERSCAVTFGEKIILTGGFNGYSYLSNVLEFEPQRGTWIELAPMSSGHEGHKSVVKDDRIWVVGGLNSGNALDKVESYDAFTNTWRQEPSLNTPRSWPVVWTTSEGIYAAGGNDGNSFLSSIEFFTQWGQCMGACRR